MKNDELELEKVTRCLEWQNVWKSKVDQEKITKFDYLAWVVVRNFGQSTLKKVDEFVQEINAKN